MSLNNGLYKVSFGTPLGEGYGVVVLNEGSISGGDSSMFYAGAYQQDGDVFSANIEIGTHSSVPGMGSVFGVPSGSVRLSGSATDKSATMTGTSPQAPGVQLRATLQFLQ